MWNEWKSTIWPEKVLMAEVSVGQVPRLGWINDVKVALDNRGMIVEDV